jgi:hypothetical protein
MKGARWYRVRVLAQREGGWCDKESKGCHVCELRKGVEFV